MLKKSINDQNGSKISSFYFLKIVSNELKLQKICLKHKNISKNTSKKLEYKATQ